MNGGYDLSTEVPQITSVTYGPVAGDISSRVGRDNVRAGLGTPDGFGWMCVLPKNITANGSAHPILATIVLSAPVGFPGQRIFTISNF